MRDLYKHGFVANYTRWIYHGEGDRIREEVVRPRLEEYDGDAGMADMMADFHDARFVQVPMGQGDRRRGNNRQ